MRDNQTFPVKAVWPNSAELGLGVRLAVPESTSNRLRDPSQIIHPLSTQLPHLQNSERDLEARLSHAVMQYVTVFLLRTCPSLLRVLC